MDQAVEDGARAARYVGFVGARRVAAGALAEVAAALRRAQDLDPEGTALAFDRETGRVVDLDLRGTAEAIVARLAPEAAGLARRGRPKLGVVAREVTLLPHHWDWLSQQSGGASVTLRRLVEAARKDPAQIARARTEAAYRFLAAMAGDRPGFEEASRALFAGDRAGLEQRMAPWPADIQAEARRLIDGPSA